MSVSGRLKTTALAALHEQLGAKMVPFAGYAMPLQYGGGIIDEHVHTRTNASLFDISHMGQIAIKGADAASSMEALVPGDITGLKAGAMRYTLLTNDTGGILDDIIVGRTKDGLMVVVNAACKDQDFAHIQAGLGAKVGMAMADDRALLALQGPAAAEVLGRLAPDSRGLAFMTAADLSVGGVPCRIFRAGYTGEDGFEISLAAVEAEPLARKLLAAFEVKPAGLGARDTLRLEAGFCLYGQDIDTGTTPVEAGLGWTISRRRRAEGGFPGAEVILRQLREGPPRKRVGIRPEGRAPARAGTEVTDAQGRRLGTITSGGFGPTVGGPIAIGYVAADHAVPGTELRLVVRGKPLPAAVVPLPFVAPNTFQPGKTTKPEEKIE
ncbi:MAG: glycine cleavage system aminomethyltransferase GcvT [Alphaproteobacteria bacterium]